MRLLWVSANDTRTETEIVNVRGICMREKKKGKESANGNGNEIDMRPRTTGEVLFRGRLLRNAIMSRRRRRIIEGPMMIGRGDRLVRCWKKEDHRLLHLLLYLPHQRGVPPLHLHLLNSKTVSRVLV